VTLLSLAAPVQAQSRKAEVKGAAAKTAPATPAASIDPQGKRMEKLLNLWAQQSGRLKTLDVRIKQTVQTSEAWGGQPQQFDGRAIFKSPNLAWIDFQQVVVDENKKKKLVPNERIICTGKEVWHYLSKTQQIHIYPLGKQQRERALQEGPLPFLFNFKAEEAKQRYRMTLLKEDDKCYVIGILPNEQIDKESFSKAFIRLDSQYLLPTQVLLYPVDEKSGLKNFVLSDIKPNVAVMEENFRGQRLGKPWTIHINEESSSAGPAAAQNTRRAAPRQPMLGKAAPSNRAR